MKKLNVAVTALLMIGFTGLAYGEMGKCNGMQNSNMKKQQGMMQGNQQGMMQGNQGMMQGKQQGMMQNSKSQMQINRIKQCVNAATTLQEIENCKVGNQGMMQGNQQGMMQDSQGMMQMKGGSMENKAGKCKGN